MRITSLIILLVNFILLQSFVSAWGYKGHRMINEKAAILLDGELGFFVNKHKNALKWYGAVPDYIKTFHPEEKPLHFFDADYYDEYPFKNIPMNFERFKEKYGSEKLTKMGTAPWAIQKSCNEIIYYLKNARLDEAIFHMGVLAHYVADIHNPLHTILNYDGQLTGNKGVHFRWEVRLFNEYVESITPIGEIKKIDSPVGYAMDIVRESYKDHKRILDGDTKARKVLTHEQQKKLSSYDVLNFENEYLEILNYETIDLLNERLGKSVVRIAAYWQYCWDMAGKPNLNEK